MAVLVIAAPAVDPTGPTAVLLPQLHCSKPAHQSAPAALVQREDQQASACPSGSVDLLQSRENVVERTKPPAASAAGGGQHRDGREHSLFAEAQIL